MASTNTGAAKATRKATSSARTTSGGGRAPAKRATSRSSTTTRKTATASRRTSTTRARRTDAGRTGRSAATGAIGHGVDDLLRPVSSAARQTVGVVSVPVGQARRVLDRKGGLPVYLGAGALAVIGALEWPVAAGVGLGYAGLRRWGSRLPEPLRSLTGSRPDR